MIHRQNDRIAVAALQYGLAAVLAFGALAANASAKEPDRFVVHEWGTFSTFSGSDGKPLKFYPDDRDLPAFVHGRHRQVKGGRTDVYVSLETPGPVLLHRPRPDRVRPGGLPEGADDRLVPAGQPAAGAAAPLGRPARCWPRTGRSCQGEGDGGRYFAARETDAATVRTAGGQARGRAVPVLPRGRRLPACRSSSGPRGRQVRGQEHRQAPGPRLRAGATSRTAR